MCGCVWEVFLVADTALPPQWQGNEKKRKVFIRYCSKHFNLSSVYGEAFEFSLGVEETIKKKTNELYLDWVLPKAIHSIFP